MTATSTTEATLQGTVDPEGQETTYHFEYGETTSYGTSVPAPSVSAASSTSDLEESRAITSLEPERTYDFRLVATNNIGTTYGENETFTTGPAWRVTPTGNPSGTATAALRSVSCASATRCVAVGDYELEGSSPTRGPVAEQWNGTEWSLQTTTGPAGTEKATLDGVSCALTTACTAVGYYQTRSSVDVSMTETWNGSGWSFHSSAEPGGEVDSVLTGVSCTSVSACTAVGRYENGSGVEGPWAERWNGSTWSLQTVTPPSGAKATYPTGVSCTSSTACAMSGWYEGSSSTEKVPFAESWNSTEWTSQSVPKPSGSRSTVVSGISCSASTACALVGSYDDSGGVEVTLAERWNGTEWAVQSTPNPSGAKRSFLDGGVSCASSEVCIAVGYSLNSSSKDVTLAERWNGTEWKIQTTPNDEKEEDLLSGGVSCSSSTSCAAVGTTGKTFAEVYG